MAEKVLMVGQFPPPVTGEGKMNLQVQQMLQQAGFSVAVLNSCIVDSVNDVGRLSVLKLFRTLKWLWSGLWRQGGTDILYMTPGQTLFGLLRFLPLLWLGRLRAKKLLLHWHGYGVLSAFTKYPRLAGFYLAPAVCNIVLTADLKTKLQRLGLDVSNVHVLGNFSEISPTFTNRETEPARLKVVYLGGLMAEKGIDTFLQLASSSGQFELVVCGAGDAAITAKVQALAAAGALDYRGVIDGKAKQQLFSEADVFVLQTHHPTEGVPLTILEAMACGCAILTTAHNGIPETVGDAAVFVEPQSLNSLMAALSTLDQQRAQLRVLQQRAFIRSQNFSAAVFKQELIKLFRI